VPTTEATPAPQAALVERAFADEEADDVDMGARHEEVETADDEPQHCQRHIRAERKRAAREPNGQPDPETQLVLGRCYAKLGKPQEARIWLNRAAAQPETAERAKAALTALD
ncbi:MAG: hypothetical protein WBG86_16160, partial [Polyangiales bacterium]